MSKDNEMLLKIREIVREANDDQLVSIKVWTRENFVSQNYHNKTINDLKDEHIYPLKMKVYGAIMAGTILLGSFQLIMKIMA